jgi:hypothetical protein
MKVMRRSAFAVGPWAVFVVLLSFTTGCFKQHGHDQQKYSDSLLVAPFAKTPKYLIYPDGRQHLIYTTETPYPADDLLSFLRTELQKRGWKPLPEDFFNPGTPSSLERGWTFFEDHTQQPWTGVYAWSADWENDTHDLTEYVLRYEAPYNSTRNLRNVRVIALFIPANIEAKMKRSIGPKKK